MTKLTSSLMFVVAFATISGSIAQPLTHGPIPIDKLFNQTPILTQIRFHKQAVDVGAKETTYRIANALITNQSPTRFGFLTHSTICFTETSDPRSNPVGRIQGLFGSADLKEITAYNSDNVYFTTGVHNRSTINIAGRDPVFSDYRELFIGGGTRFFRLARGIVTLRAITEKNATMNAVIEFNAMVIHATA